MKEKINFFFKILKKNRDKSIKIGITSVIALTVIAASLTVSYAITNKENQEEKKLKTYLQEMGTEFYENFYYDQVGSSEKERKQVLEKFKDIGVKISLSNLEKYNTEANKEKIDAFLNNKEVVECDKENTKIIIYPEEPYKVDTYHYELNLVCNFVEEK